MSGLKNSHQVNQVSASTKHWYRDDEFKNNPDRNKPTPTRRVPGGRKTQQTSASVTFAPGLETPATPPATLSAAAAVLPKAPPAPMGHAAAWIGPTAPATPLGGILSTPSAPTGGKPLTSSASTPSMTFGGASSSSIPMTHSSSRSSAYFEPASISSSPPKLPRVQSATAISTPLTSDQPLPSFFSNTGLNFSADGRIAW